MSIKNKQGVFLVEILLTLVIVSVSLVLIIQSLLSVHRGAHRGARHAMAALMAENQMNEFIGNPLARSHQQGALDEPLDYISYRIERGDNTLAGSGQLEQASLYMTWPVGGRDISLVLDSFYLKPQSQE